MTALADHAPAAPPLDRLRLENGLRVVLAPDPAAPAVAVAVQYAAGFRSEEPGHGGYAHLFEHLMFEGSENVAPGGHALAVQAAGGVFNGTTYRDHTSYHQVVPAGALERTLFLEADRMRGPRVTEATLRAQLAVVREEIRRKVTAQPFGGFPVAVLPPAVFTAFANTHDGFGDLGDLAACTPADCAAFFDRGYAPGNAVLTLCGDFDPAQAARLAERYFGGVPARPAPPATPLAEPLPDTDHQVRRTRPGLPMAALAAGLRMPDPGTDLPGYLAAALAAAVLGDGGTSLLHRTAVRDRRLAVQVHAGAGLGGTPLECRDPDLIVVRAMLTDPGNADAVLDAAWQALHTLADAGPEDAALARARTRMAVTAYRDLDRLGARARALGRFELLHGRAGLATEVPALLLTTGPDAVRAAAAALARQPRRSVLLLPEGSPAAPGNPAQGAR